jgi:hypothetical protein
LLPSELDLLVQACLAEATSSQQLLLVLAMLAGDLVKVIRLNTYLSAVAVVAVRVLVVVLERVVT